MAPKHFSTGTYFAEQQSDGTHLRLEVMSTGSDIRARNDILVMARSELILSNRKLMSLWSPSPALCFHGAPACYLMGSWAQPPALRVLRIPSQVGPLIDLISQCPVAKL